MDDLKTTQLDRSTARGWSWKLVQTPWRWITDHLHKRADYRHQFRLEKEDPLYRELWDQLFLFRRAAHNCFQTLQDRIIANPEQDMFDAFNAFQATAHRKAPFIHPTILHPSREITAIGHKLSTCLQRRQRYGEVRDGSLDRFQKEFEENEKEINELLAKLDEHYRAVESAINSRIFMMG